MRFNRYKSLILLAALLFGSTIAYISFAQTSVWDCWETSYSYKYMIVHEHTKFDSEDIIKTVQMESTSLLFVKINNNNITFRSPYIHLHYMGLQHFNTSEEYDNYLSEVWDYDPATNTSKVTLIYLDSEKKVCLADNQSKMSYSNFSLPIDIVELISQMFSNGHLIKAWFIPVNSPDFDILTDYSAYNINTTSGDDHYLKLYSGALKNIFWFKGRYIQGYKLTLTITEEKMIKGSITFESRADIELCYSKAGVLYSYSYISVFDDYEVELSAYTNVQVVLEEPHKGLGGISIYLVCLVILTLIGVTTASIIVIKKKRSA
ncbi:MAG: hypothetical protein ACTSUF_07255 [Candidatus Heimdallarchaeaceae archaeon]